MGEFFSTLFSGMSLDSLLVYACAIRGVMVSSKNEGPGILSQLITRTKSTSASKK